MVSVSVETAEAIDARLRRVVGLADLDRRAGEWVYVEHPLDAPPALSPDALAVVRDDEVWSVLRPAAAGDPGDRFAVFSFHFPAGVDNSGFVGWLATLIKRETGSGVLVVCGQHEARGGIFDHWGCPVAVADAVLDVVDGLRRVAPADRAEGVKEASD